MLEKDVIDYLQKPKVFQAVNSNEFEIVFLNAPGKIRNELVNIFNESNIDFLSSMHMIYPDMFRGIGEHTLDLSRYKNIEAIASSAFWDCEYEAIILPESVNRIYPSAFSHCGCTYVDISKTKVNMLPDSVFEGSIHLEKVILCDGLQVISSDCFRNCGKLKEITLPKTIEKLESNVFYKCYPLSEIKYEGTVADWHKVEKGDAYYTGWDVGHIKVVCRDGSTYFLED